MPTFEPFPALRYCDRDVDDLVAPPYDVLSDADVVELEARNRFNIVHVDVPREPDGGDRYEHAAQLLTEWIDAGVMEYDATPTFTLYRMRFDDAGGRARSIVGVLGGLEVVDPGAGGVLPHERVTPKASTDRLDLTRATRTNLSPIWGLSLAGGLTDLLAEPGEMLSSVTVAGVEHVVERVAEPARIAAIAERVGSDDVLIADGHHRYGVAQRYRDERRAAGAAGPAEATLAFVGELTPEQLSVEAIHRVYSGVEWHELLDALDSHFERRDAPPATPERLAEMSATGALYLLGPTGDGWWLTPRDDAFDGDRSLDGVWLETALAGVHHEVAYQHGVDRVRQLVDDGAAVAAVLINPVSVAEIERTAREGLLMPPKSTYFTPKLRTGFVVRSLV